MLDYYKDQKENNEYTSKLSESKNLPKITSQLLNILLCFKNSFLYP